MSTTVKCRAKDPATCKFHTVGEPIDSAHAAVYERLETAQNAFDFEAYGQAFTELQLLDGELKRIDPNPLVTEREKEGKIVAKLIDEALDLANRATPPTKQELTTLYSRVPNEVLGETLLTFLKGKKGNNLAIVAARNPYMYRVLASNIRQYQPNAKICEQILASGDHRARLLLASHLKHDFRAIQGGAWQIADDLAHDADPEIREYIAAVEDIYPGGSATTHSNTLTKRLRDDPNADVRLALARNQRISLEDAEVLANDTDPRILEEVKPRVERMQSELRTTIAAEQAYAAEYKTRFEAGQLTEDEIEDLNWDDEHAYFKYYAN